MRTMGVIISMLRAVNVGGHNKIKMDALRALYESMKLRDAQTYVQSGNVIFRTEERDLASLGKRIQNGIERKFGFRPDVILRTASELRDVIARNIFLPREGTRARRFGTRDSAAKKMASCSRWLKINLMSSSP